MEPSTAGHLIETIRRVIEWAAVGIEVLAVAVIVAAVVVLAVTRGTVRYLFHIGDPGSFANYKHQLGKALLLGLDLLVAADVVRTVALEANVTNVGVLGLLVVIRTFLSWSLAVEMDGRWPWQPKKETARNGTAGPAVDRARGE